MDFLKLCGICRDINKKYPNLTEADKQIKIDEMVKKHDIDVSL